MEKEWGSTLLMESLSPLVENQEWSRSQPPPTPQKTNCMARALLVPTAGLFRGNAAKARIMSVDEKSEENSPQPRASMQEGNEKRKI